MTEFKEGQLLMCEDGGVTCRDTFHEFMGCYESIRLPAESELRELVPQVYEELDALRNEKQRLNRQAKEALHVGALLLKGPRAMSEEERLRKENARLRMELANMKNSRDSLHSRLEYYKALEAIIGKLAYQKT